MNERMQIDLAAVGQADVKGGGYPEVAATG